MSNKYEDLIKNARVNAECGEHMSPAEVTTLLNVVETTFAALAAENAGLKQLASEAYDEMVSHHDTDGLYSLDADGEQMDALIRLCDAQATIYETLVMCETPATDAFLSEVRAQVWMEAKDLARSAIASDSIDHIDFLFDGKAAQLRKGVQS